MNKKQKDMLKQCRYYYGEEKCDLLIPNNDIEWFWMCEKEWVELGRDKVDRDSELFEFYQEGGKKRPGIPESLLDLMFHYFLRECDYMDESEIVAEFDELIDKYLFIANDHYPEDKIPNNE